MDTVTCAIDAFFVANTVNSISDIYISSAIGAASIAGTINAADTICAYETSRTSVSNGQNVGIVVNNNVNANIYYF